MKLEIESGDLCVSRTDDFVLYHNATGEKYLSIKDMRCLVLFASEHEIIVQIKGEIYNSPLPQLFWYYFKKTRSPDVWQGLEIDPKSTQTKFNNFYLPSIASNNYPRLKTSEIIKIQPMSLPSGAIFYLGYKYDQSKNVSKPASPCDIKRHGKNDKKSSCQKTQKAPCCL